MNGEEYRVSKEETVADKMMVKAMVAHQGQFREGTGHLPYIVHPASVVIRLKRWGYTEEKNPNVLAIGWGHDLLEDTEVPEWEIAALTNGEVLKGIKMLTFKPPKKMRYEVTQVLLMDDCGQECDPFDIPEGFIPVYINLHLGKRIN